MTPLSWPQELLERLRLELDEHPPGKRGIILDSCVRVHLAIFVQPYLRLIMEGRKTVESRFGVQRCAPHGRVSRGDVVALKLAGGPVVGVCRVKRTWFFDLRVTKLDAVRERFASALCAEDPAFWASRSEASLATLMEIDKVTPVESIRLDKRDRRGWVIVQDRTLCGDV